MIGSDVIKRVRNQIDDDKRPYRQNELKLYRYLSDAIKDLFKRRPDLQLYDNGGTDALRDLEAIDFCADATTVPFSDIMIEPLVNYICYLVLQEDAEDTENAQKASKHFKLYIGSI